MVKRELCSTMASQLSPLQLEGCHNELTFSSIDEFVNEGFSPELEQSFKIVTAEPISDRPTEGFHGCFVSVAARVNHFGNLNFAETCARSSLNRMVHFRPSAAVFKLGHDTASPFSS